MTYFEHNKYGTITKQPCHKCGAVREQDYMHLAEVGPNNIQFECDEHCTHENWATMQGECACGCRDRKYCLDCDAETEEDSVTWSDGTHSPIKDGIVLGQFCDEPSEPYAKWAWPDTEDGLILCCLMFILFCVMAVLRAI